MDQLTIPKHPGLLEALGRLAVAHTHLELILRYTVKTLAGLSVKEALDATNRARISDVRRRIRKLFEQKKPLELEKAKLEALLGAATRLSEERRLSSNYRRDIQSAVPKGNHTPDTTHTSQRRVTPDLCVRKGFVLDFGKDRRSRSASLLITFLTPYSLQCYGCVFHNLVALS